MAGYFSTGCVLDLLCPLGCDFCQPLFPLGYKPNGNANAIGKRFLCVAFEVFGKFHDADSSPAILQSQARLYLFSKLTSNLEI